MPHTPKLARNLAAVQTAVRDTVLGASADRLKGVVADDRLGYARRLNVYRNNTTILLREALAANFPVIHALVGEDFFANLARAFVRTHPPQSPCLFEYGDDFPGFIEDFTGARDLPYLADVARLEWAWVEAHHADDAPALNAEQLSSVLPEDYGRLIFAIHPAARVIASPYPIHAIWAMHQADADPDATVDLNQGGEAVLVTRPGAHVRVTVLGPGEDGFIHNLADGETLGDAFANAQAKADNFDAAHALTLLLTQGVLSAHALTEQT